MTMNSKLMLSEHEQQLVQNTEWILTKRVIVEKVNLLLGELSAKHQGVIAREAAWLPVEAVQSSPKIARGENYLQLPYLLLDYPRCFNGDDIFAVRTMFWWGNFFSVTLHLSGTYKQHFAKSLLQHAAHFKKDYFICIHENQWQHHFEADNYVSIDAVSPKDLGDLLQNKPFVKLARRFALQPWDALPALLEKCFVEMMELLKH